MADAPAPLSLSAGDRVVYPNQGVCRVTGIEEKEVAGQKLVFVTMQREEDGARVMVPKPKLQAIGVRKIASHDEVREIFSFLNAETEKADLDWKQRARTNLDRMSAGGLLGLAEVVKGLQVLSELRPLPTKERELYDNARHLLVTETAAALSIPSVNAEDAIDIALFPPGKERPKRTAEEFKRLAGDDDDLDLGDDLLGIGGGDLGLPEDEAPAEGEDAESDEAEPSDEDEGAPKKTAAKKPPKAELSDDEVTMPMGTALVPDEQLPPKRKRGRPPKPKPPEAEAAAAVPKKRGRPPKPKPPVEASEPPKKRGRPPKSAAAAPKKK